MIDEIINKKREYLYYTLIAIVAIVASCIGPILSGSITGKNPYPEDSAGWAIWILNRCISFVTTMSIFICFVEAGKFKGKQTERYKEACQILIDINHKRKKKKKKPISPVKWNFKTYGLKLFFTCVSSAVATGIIASIDPSFSWADLISIIITIVTGIVMGSMQMMKTYDFYKDGIYEYAIYLQKEVNDDANKIS